MGSNMSVDVVIPIRNGEVFIADCLESIHQQSRFDFINRILVINDGSTDKSAEVAEGFKSKLANLEVFTVEPIGLSGARNFGLAMASATHVAFLDCDDLWLQHKIKYHEEHLLAHPSCLFSFTASLQFQDGSNTTEPQGINIVSPTFESILLQKFRIYGSGSSVFANREFLISKGGFDETLTFGEDWDLWLRMAEEQLPCEIYSIGTKIRIHPSSMQRKKKIGDKRFLNSDIHFYEWEKYPSIFANRDFQSVAIGILWAEIRRNFNLKFVLGNDLHDFHRKRHRVALDKIGLFDTRFFKIKVFAKRVIKFSVTWYK